MSWPSSRSRRATASKSGTCGEFARSIQTRSRLLGAAGCGDSCTSSFGEDESGQSPEGGSGRPPDEGDIVHPPATAPESNISLERKEVGDEHCGRPPGTHECPRTSIAHG